MSYKDLKSYRQTKIIHDFSREFCDRYIDKFSRTHDQMVQAGRSGKQNISEGFAQNDESGERKLTKISRGSLEELLEDYEDFLRQRGAEIWGKDSKKSKEVRKLVYKIDEIYKSHKSDRSDRSDWRRKAHKESYNLYKKYLEDPEKAANVMICLINQTNYLLDQQIRKLEEKPPMSKKDRWWKNRAKKKRKKERKDFKQMLKKHNEVYTRRGIMDKEEADRRGLEEIDLPPV